MEIENKYFFDFGLTPTRPYMELDNIIVFHKDRGKIILEISCLGCSPCEDLFRAKFHQNFWLNLMKGNFDVSMSCSKLAYFER